MKKVSKEIVNDDNKKVSKEIVNDNNKKVSKEIVNDNAKKNQIKSQRKMLLNEQKKWKLLKICLINNLEMLKRF